ncbi:aspartate 1-decarboxylase [Nonomuraea candida]|uniref:aspartate 1-decarboxylase n=1 Tax=Nonomuraea candida TaxID=359159 RepID=UPI0005BD57D4|nr:aspartate 1-decarboxylase [Nonomuraea candida]
MRRTMLRSSIQPATVTQADLHYVGSLTVSGDLIEAAGLLPGEKVDVVDIDNGHRLSTYVIEGPRNSGVIGVNGAAARLISPGDRIIISGFAEYPDREARGVRPVVVVVDAANALVSRLTGLPGTRTEHRASFPETAPTIR